MSMFPSKCPLDMKTPELCSAGVCDVCRKARMDRLNEIINGSKPASPSTFKLRPSIQATLDEGQRIFETMLNQNSRVRTCDHECMFPLFPNDPFDVEVATKMSASEVRKRWPRFSGVCRECKSGVNLYESSEHYTLGDW